MSLFGEPAEATGPSALRPGAGQPPAVARAPSAQDGRGEAPAAAEADRGAITVTGAGRDARLPVAAPASLSDARRRVAVLTAREDDTLRRREALAKREAELAAWLALAPAIETTLDELSQTLFAEVVGVLERMLTLALHDVLDQPLSLKVEQDWKRGAASMSFHIERGGEREDVLRGQGGSVANVLSTCLRIFALDRLDGAKHRRFLVLDEQDCWLRPDLVPRFVRLVHESARRLGFQVLMISHHDVGLFEEFADRIYRLVPDEAGVRVVRHDAHRDLG